MVLVCNYCATYVHLDVNIAHLCSTQIFSTELETHETQRKRLQGFAVQIVSTCPSAPFSEKVRSRQQNINCRLEELCRELGLSYQKVEETLFSLQLLEAMLKRLNIWLQGVEDKAYGFASHAVDEQNEKHRLLDIKVGHRTEIKMKY